MDYLTTIIVALISGICTAVPTIISTSQNNRRNTELIQYQIQELSTRVEKHNNVVERMALAELNLKQVWKQIDEIKQEVHSHE